MTTTLQITVGSSEVNSILIGTDDDNGNPIEGTISVPPGSSYILVVDANTFIWLTETNRTADIPDLLITP